MGGLNGFVIRYPNADEWLLVHRLICGNGITLMVFDGTLETKFFPTINVRDLQ